MRIAVTVLCRLATGLRQFVREANAGSAAVIRVNRPWDTDGPLHWQRDWTGPLLVGRYLPEATDATRGRPATTPHHS